MQPAFSHDNESLPEPQWSSNLAKKKKPKSKGTNIKFSPALYWKTITTSAEFPLSERSSLGLTAFAKYGLNDSRFTNLPANTETFLNDGLGGELFFRYYFKKRAPEGLYLQAYGGYNQIVNFDGSVRPYTLYNTWNMKNQVKSASTLIKPQPYNFGISSGFQLIIIPDHIVGDVLLGVQGNIDKNNSLFFSVYLLPSIGYKF